MKRSMAERSNKVTFSLARLGCGKPGAMHPAPKRTLADFEVVRCVFSAGVLGL